MSLNVTKSTEHWIGSQWITGPAFQEFDHTLLRTLAQLTDWPSIDAYTKTFYNAPIPFVEQNSEELKACGGYERYIEKHHAIPTRPQNIHDFMNALVWQHLPISKLSLHRAQSQEYRRQLQSPHNKRSPLQNACTLFDECGVILISKNKSFLQAIREHRWKDLFYLQREALYTNSRLIILGHALLEKSLHPYLGMCGNLIHLDAHPESTSLHEIDQQLSLFIQHDLSHTKQLHAFPILGYPHWHPDNTQETFYNNTAYFRPI